MVGATRKRALTMSTLDPKNPPSSPNPKPSKTDTQPTKFSLPPSSCQQQNYRQSTSLLEPDDASTKSEEFNGHSEGILSSSAPSACFPTRYIPYLSTSYHDTDELDINYPSMNGSPSFRLSGFESPYLGPRIDSFLEDLPICNDRTIQFEGDILSSQVVGKTCFNREQNITPFTTRSSSTFSNFSHSKNSNPYRSDNYKHESDSVFSCDFSSDDESSNPNHKMFPTSPILRYTLREMKRKGSGFDESLEPTEFTLDETFLD